MAACPATKVIALPGSIVGSIGVISIRPIVADLLERLGVPPGIAGLPVDRIVKRTRADKKRLDGNLRFVLPRRIGEVALVDDVDEETVRAGVVYIQERYP